MSRALLKAHAERMKSIVFLGTGIASYVDPQDGEDFGIAVRYIAGYGDRSIAEHAFALLMSAARKLSQMDREMKSGTWSAFEGAELRGKTLGIVGTGAVGAELCRSAAGFGMNCIAWNRSGGASSLPCKEVPLKQVFRDADAVSLHNAFSDTTNKMIFAPFLQSMKPGANLVNTARGSVVDDLALSRHSRRGHWVTPLSMSTRSNP